MQAAPALAFEAEDGGVARAAIAMLAGLAAAVTAGQAFQWLAVASDGRGDAPWLGAGMVALAAAMAAGWCWRRYGRSDVRLRWDTRQWHWQAPGHAPLAGWLRVALDLGPWLLLAIDPERSPAARGWRLPAPVSRRWVALGRATAGPAHAALFAKTASSRTAA